MFEFAKKCILMKSRELRTVLDTNFSLLLRLLNSPAIMAVSLTEESSLEPKLRSPKETKTRWFSSNPNELCDTIKLLLHEKQAGKISHISNEEGIAIANKVIEYKCYRTKQHSYLQLKGAVVCTVNKNACAKAPLSDLINFELIENY